MDLKTLIQNTARDVGFHRAVIGSLKPLDSERIHFEEWLAKGYAAGMDWLKRNPHFRTSPALLFPGCRSAIIVSASYFTPTPPEPAEPFGRVARYAVGRDYHVVLRAKLRELKTRIESQIGRPLLGKAFTDDVALYEQAYANRHGLGFAGKNTMIIGPSMSGSYNFVAELFTDLEVEPDEPYRGTCGNCFRCGAACPTNAIEAPGVLNASKCISYLTIEHKGAIPVQLRSAFGEWIFGCDVCQEVCPYNQRPQENVWTEFMPESGVGHFLNLYDVLNFKAESDFHRAFVHTAVRRPKLRGLQRNALVVAGNHLSGRTGKNFDDERMLQYLKDYFSNCADLVLREHAAWAVAQSSCGSSRRVLEYMWQRETDLDNKIILDKMLA